MDNDPHVQNQEVLSSGSGWHELNRKSVRINNNLKLDEQLKLHQAPDEVIFTSANRRKKKKTVVPANKKDTVERETAEKINDDEAMGEMGSDLSVGSAMVLEPEDATRVLGLDMEGESAKEIDVLGLGYGVKHDMCTNITGVSFRVLEGTDHEGMESALLVEEGIEKVLAIENLGLIEEELDKDSMEKIDGLVSGYKAKVDMMDSDLSVEMVRALEVNEGVKGMEKCLIVDKDEERMVGVESNLCLIEEEKVENKATIDNAQGLGLEVSEGIAGKIDGPISGCEGIEEMDIELNVASDKVSEVMRETGSMADGFTEVSKNMVLGEGMKEVSIESSRSIEEKLESDIPGKIDGLVLGCEPIEEMESDLTGETFEVLEWSEGMERVEMGSVVDSVDEGCDFGLLIGERREEVPAKSNPSLKEELESQMIKKIDGQNLDFLENLEDSGVLKSNESVNDNEEKKKTWRSINIPDLNEPYDGNE